MATIQDIGVSAAINILSAIVFLPAFAFLRLQPINDWVYFPNGTSKVQESPSHGGTFVRFGPAVILERSFLKFLSLMPAALEMSENEMISHAGLDSAVYLRIYLIGFIAHLVMAYVFTFWTCYVLLREYEIVAKIRLRFLASERRIPDQITPRLYDGCGMHEDILSIFKYVFFWVVLLISKLAFCFYVEKFGAMMQRSRRFNSSIGSTVPV